LRYHRLLVKKDFHDHVTLLVLNLENESRVSPVGLDGVYFDDSEHEVPE
jgi:hypothetical protein